MKKSRRRTTCPNCNDSVDLKKRLGGRVWSRLCTCGHWNREDCRGGRLVPLLIGTPLAQVSSYAYSSTESSTWSGNWSTTSVTIAGSYA